MQSIEQYIFARQLQPSYATLDTQQGKETQQACTQGGREQHQTSCMLWLRQHPHIHTSRFEQPFERHQRRSGFQGLRQACMRSVRIQRRKGVVPCCVCVGAMSLRPCGGLVRPYQSFRNNCMSPSGQTQSWGPGPRSVKIRPSLTFNVKQLGARHGSAFRVWVKVLNSEGLGFRLGSRQ